jgi:AraC family transcriptional regulator
MIVSSEHHTQTSIEHWAPAILSQVVGAVATFDADPNASRRYLESALAILKAGGNKTDLPVPVCARKSTGGLAAWRMSRILQYVESHIDERIMVCALARLVGLSPSHFSRAFKCAAGVTAASFIMSRRVALACTKLSTSKEPITQVAISCGLSDQPHLCRVFRRVTGLSPAKWRRANTVLPDRGAPL